MEREVIDILEDIREKKAEYLRIGASIDGDGIYPTCACHRKH